MSSVDGLAPDQRAVLQLVLQRGRSYDEIAQLLSIDRAAVRQRALSAFEALGPQTGVDPERRALITDYLLGQLPPAVADETRSQLAGSPSERAWARVIASELAPIAGHPLPEIPSSAPRPQPTEPLAPIAAAPAAAEPEAAPASEAQPTGSPPGPVRPPSSRLGGLILIGLAIVAAIVVAVILITSGGSPKNPSRPSGGPSPAASRTTTSSTSSSAARIVAQISLAPSQAHSKAAGIAEVLKEGAAHGIAIVAAHVAPNTTKPPNAYAVWLYNSATDAQLLGFVNPGVGKNGRLSTAGGLPTNAGRFRQLIVTLETKADPKIPGTIILHGALSGLS